MTPDQMELLLQSISSLGLVLCFGLGCIWGGQR